MPRRRRLLRKLSDLPTLWDDIGLDNTSGEVSEPDFSFNTAPKVEPDTPLPATDIPDLSLQRSVTDELIFLSFGSGSSGNSAFIGVKGKGGVILDAGIDPEKMIAALHNNNIPLSQIEGVIITHDHSDHVRYAYTLMRRLRHSAFFATMRTLEGMLRRHSISRRIKDYHKPIFKECEFALGPFVITPFEVSHDACDNVGFSLAYGGRYFVIATDMGKITDRADFYIRRANYLMIEANYDATMLAQGKYPEYLKARIQSERGHLDNAVTAAYLAEIWQPQLTDIYLCHLSQDNNRPEIALSTIIDTLKSRGVNVVGDANSLFGSDANVRVSALPRFEASPLFIHRL